jgi:hypothetical protein
MKTKTLFALISMIDLNEAFILPLEDTLLKNAQELASKEHDPVVINTWVTGGFIDAAKRAWDVLEVGGSALDAVEHGCNSCEEL